MTQKAENGRELWGTLDFCVPLIPPSVNHYVKHTRRGFHYVTKEAKEFKRAVALLSDNRCVRFEAYFIEIYLNLGKGDRMDADNCAKVIIDALADAGIIHSDSAVTDLTIHKRRDWANPRTCITIWEPAHEFVRRGVKRLKSSSENK